MGYNLKAVAFALCVFAISIADAQNADDSSGSENNPTDVPENWIAISPEELFMKCDINQDGVISLEEFQHRKMYEKLRGNPDVYAEMAAVPFNEMDENGDGVLDPTEFNLD